MYAKLLAGFDDQSDVHFVDWLKTSQQLLYYDVMLLDESLSH